MCFWRCRGEKWALEGMGETFSWEIPGLERSLGVWGLHSTGDSAAAGVRVEMESH